MTTLYAIVDELTAIDTLLEETGGEWTEAVQARMDAAWDALGNKVDAIGHYWREIEARQALRVARVKVLEEEMRRQQAHAVAEGNRLAGLKRYVQLHLARTGETKWAGQAFTLSVQQNSIEPLDILEPDAFRYPDALCRVVRSIDAKAVRAALMSGETGDASFAVVKGILTQPDGSPLARLGERGAHVRLR